LGGQDVAEEQTAAPTEGPASMKAHKNHMKKLRFMKKNKKGSHRREEESTEEPTE